MPFTPNYTRGNELDQIMDPENARQDPFIARQFDAMQRMQDAASERGSLDGVRPGDLGRGGPKVIAQIPMRVLVRLLKKHPDFLQDGLAVRRVLDKYPIYRKYRKYTSYGGK